MASMELVRRVSSRATFYSWIGPSPGSAASRLRTPTTPMQNISVARNANGSNGSLTSYFTRARCPRTMRVGIHLDLPMPRPLKLRAFYTVGYNRLPYCSRCIRSLPRTPRRQAVSVNNFGPLFTLCHTPTLVSLLGDRVDATMPTCSAMYILQYTDNNPYDSDSFGPSRLVVPRTSCRSLGDLNSGRTVVHTAYAFY